MTTTMATEENNIQINTFTEGMNMDWAYDSIKNTQYRYGLNVRATNIIGDSNNVSIKSGVLSSIYMYNYSLSSYGNDDLNQFRYSSSDFFIYKTVLCGDYTIVIYKNNVSKLNIGQLVEDSNIKYKHICSIKAEDDYNPENISAVLHYEQDNVVNLYIADGIHNIIVLNIADTDFLDSLSDSITIGDETVKLIPIEYILQNNYFPSTKPIIVEKTSGQLKTSQVQYAYRLYKKHGNCSKLSPLTNKIHIINDLRYTETGNAEDTTTSIGIRLLISNNDKLIKTFDSVQLYRIQYIKPGQNAEISLIYDGKFSDGLTSSIDFSFTDDGKKSVLDLSMDEFSNIDGLIIKPEILEQNLNYLFAGNVKDDTIINIEDCKTIYQHDENYKIEGNKYIFTAYQYDIKNTLIYYADNGCFYDVPLGDFPTEPLWKNIYLSDYGYGVDNWILYFTYSYFNPYCDINHSYDGDGLYVGNNVIYRNVSTCRTDSTGYVGGDGPITQWNLIIYTYLQDIWTKYKLKYDSNSEIYTYEVANIDINNTYTNTLGIKSKIDGNYSDIFTSSILRSLKFGEVYRYGVVFYNKYGRRTNVQWIADIRVPSESELDLTLIIGDFFTVGVEFSFDLTKMSEFKHEFDITGYEIVRCDKPDEYTRNLAQVATSTVVQQLLVKSTDKSPLYPTGLITSLPQKTVYPLIRSNGPFPGDMDFAESDTETKDNTNAYILIYCPEIQILRKDFLQKILSNENSLAPMHYVYTYIGGSNDRVNKNNIDPGDDSYIKDEAYNYSDAKEHILPAEYERSMNTISWAYNRYSLINTLGWTYTYEDSSYGDYLYFNIHKLDLSIDSKITKSHQIAYSYCTNSVYTIDLTFNKKETGVTINAVIPYYISFRGHDLFKIKQTIDVKNLNWEDGFSNHTYDGAVIKNAVKKYKSYLSTIGNKLYLNWICSNKYDIPIGTDNLYNWTEKPWTEIVEFTNPNNAKDSSGHTYHEHRDIASIGPIGPGGQCFIVNIKNEGYLFRKMLYTTDHKKLLENNLNNTLSYNALSLQETMGTVLCNIVHNAHQFAGTSQEEHKLDTYYGFGNYFKLDDAATPVDIFDGDVYNQYCQYVGMFKAYDFNDDKSSLQSMLTVFNIPMWSKINTYFDYGLNYRNTNNPNLLLEPGTIKNITSQERALNLYNLIYSDNNTSNNMFNVDSNNDTLNKYSQRTFYSELKTNGENIDSWLTFKAANFIDVNPKYGEITDMLTVDDQLYFWQLYAFGKFSVNERSLVKDENSNTIQLGQGDILQRSDYISTQYGMRKYDMCKISANNNIYWYDYDNYGIIKYGSSGQYYRLTGCADYSEETHVKTCMKQNKNLFLYEKPFLSYNGYFNELMFSPVYDPLDNTRAIIFNIKYNIASSFMSLPTNIIQSNLFLYKNDCFYIQSDNKNNLIISKFYGDNENEEYIYPFVVEFAVNKSPSTTKVFDNLQIVFARDYFEAKSGIISAQSDNFDLWFNTDLNTSRLDGAGKGNLTDREGNVCFAIPRDSSDNISRLRGKWMIEKFTRNNNNESFSISHIITKFRQSYN